MANDPEEEIKEPISTDKFSKYHNYPLKPTFWQRAKERLTNPDLNAELEAVRKRKLRSTGQDE